MTKDTFGQPQLCAWPVGHGFCRFQTNDPRIARKLSQRSGAVLAGWSVNKGYLRIYQERISPRAAKKLVIRYLKGLEDYESALTPTNARFLGRNATASVSEPRGRVTRAENADRGAESVLNGEGVAK